MIFVNQLTAAKVVLFTWKPNFFCEKNNSVTKI